VLAKDNSIAISGTVDQYNTNAKDGSSASSEVSYHSTPNSNAKDNSHAASIVSDHSTADANASKQLIGKRR
jgi:hypothetical protein